MNRVQTSVLAVVVLNCAYLGTAQAANIGAPGAAPGASRSAAAAPARTALPDLAFSSVTVQAWTHLVSRNPQPIIVYEAPSPAGRQPGQGASECNRAMTFPVQLSVRNIGQAEFITKGSAQAVGVSVGPWNSARDLANLAPGASQLMSFNVTLPPGQYMLQAMIDLHGQVAESRSDNNSLSWPLEVKCESGAVIAPAPINSLAPSGGIGIKRQ